MLHDRSSLISPVTPFVSDTAQHRLVSEQTILFPSLERHVAFERVEDTLANARYETAVGRSQESRALFLRQMAQRFQKADIFFADRTSRGFRRSGAVSSLRAVIRPLLLHREHCR